MEVTDSPLEAVDGWACTFYAADDPLFGVRGAKGTLRTIARAGRLLVKALRQLPPPAP